MKKIRIDKKEELQSLLNDMHSKLLGKKGVNHAVVGIASGDGSFSWVGAAGKADRDGREIDAKTPFFIASVTKLYITAAVLQLMERGKLDLDGPAAAYLPQEMMRGLHVYKGEDFSQRITIRHLLSHSSGIPDWLEDRPRRGKSMVEQIEAEEDRFISVADLANNVRENLNPHFPPGDFKGKKIRIRYSDTNFQLLIAILEHSYGESIEKVFEKKIYKPLGLQSTFHAGHGKGDTLAPADFWVGKSPFERESLIASFRDLYSTADELLIFMRALIQGKLFENPDTSMLMQEKWNRFSFPLDAVAFRLPSWPIQYSLGMMKWQLPRLYSPFKITPPVIGHTGVTGSWLFYCPAYDLYLCGTVSQLYQAPLPFRWIPQLLAKMEKYTQ